MSEMARIYTAPIHTKSLIGKKFTQAPVCLKWLWIYTAPVCTKSLIGKKLTQVPVCLKWLRIYTAPVRTKSLIGKKFPQVPVCPKWLRIYTARVRSKSLIGKKFTLVPICLNGSKYTQHLYIQKVWLVKSSWKWLCLAMFGLAPHIHTACVCTHTHTYIQSLKFMQLPMFGLALDIHSTCAQEKSSLVIHLGRCLWLNRHLTGSSVHRTYIKTKNRETPCLDLISLVEGSGLFLQRAFSH